MRASGARMLELSVTKQLGPFAFAVEATLPSAGVVALFGRSGAGKTSLVNMLAGLLRPDSGRIAVAGRVLFDSAAGIDLPPERRRIGYVFQEGQALSPSRCARQPALWPSPHSAGGAGDQAAGDRRSPRHRPSPRPAAGQSLRRREAAGGHRPGAAEQSAPPAAGRASGGAGCRAQGGDPALHRAAARRARPAYRLCQP